MTDKLDGVDAALDKWKGREERMFDKLYQKYDAEIPAERGTRTGRRRSRLELLA